MKLPPALDTPLLHLLDCHLPVLLAGMGGVARHELAAAVSRAGGFGVLGMVREPVERFRYEVEAFRQRTSDRFGVNLIPAATAPALLKEQVNTCLSLRVPVIVLFWQVDQALVKHLKAEGVTVIHQIGSRPEAECAMEAGADALIVQGYEAGGHVRGQTSTLSLLSEVALDSQVPLIASGGIASGRAMVSAFMLGAQGVSLGTVFLATQEANAHSHHKQRVKNASADDTVHTTLFQRNWPVIAPVRVLPNATLAGKYQGSHVDTVIGRQDGQDVFVYSTDSPLSDARGEIDDMALYCGQSCGQIFDICSAGERVYRIIDEAVTLLESVPYREINGQ